MTIPREVMDAFLAGTRTDQVRFVVNDKVRVTSGPNKKRTGDIASIFSLEPVTTYLIEANAEPWGSFQAGEAELELVE